MRHIIIYTCLFLLLSSFTGIRKSYPQDYFRSPVDFPLRLSGTFGELRPNHLHAGIDIKAKDGKTGQALRAVADGYISRIKVTPGGYGKVLYINHPNGYTSVYAHLQKFAKEVEDYVKQQQYKKQSFEIDVYPQANAFAFKKGERIGRLGMSGRTYGPHLHFEIRETASQKPVNPLLFGIDVEDTRAPSLRQLKVYHLNDKLESIRAKEYSLVKKRGRFGIKGDTLRIGAWRVGFALKAYDLMNGVSNLNGIYALKMLQDDQPVHSFEMESFSFSESRYINAHLDYAEQVAEKSYYNRCFRLPGNRLSIYHDLVNQGAIKLHKGKASKITMIASDLAGNESTLEFWVRRAEVPEAAQRAYNYFLPYDEESVIENNNLRVHFPKGTFYEHTYLKYSTSRDKSFGVYSPVHHIQDFKTPVHKAYTISIKPEGLPAQLKDKAFIAYCQADGKLQSCGGKWKDGYLSARTNDLGDFSVLLDTLPPQVIPIRYQRNMKGFSSMTFKVTDQYPTTRFTDGLSYRGEVDGQWVLFEFDAKKDLLIHHFDGKIGAGTHELRLLVTDDRGNETELIRSFVR